MLQVPVDGRFWLPPDTESAETLFTRLCVFHSASAKAVYRGVEHVAKHTSFAQEAADRLRAVQIIKADIENPNGNAGGSFILCGSEAPRPSTSGDTWLLAIVCLALICAGGIWLSRQLEATAVRVQRQISQPARQSTQASKLFELPKAALVK